MEKISFNVVPVFNQSANSNLWKHFAELEKKCETEKYNYKLGPKDKSRMVEDHRYGWNNFDYNMAFVAYHSNKMLGFATAYKIGEEKVYLRNLYVDPKYNGMGIGTSLLDKVERAASLVANSIEVVSLEGAISFYKEQGYGLSEERNLVKYLSKPVIGVVPVFEWKNKFNNIKKIVLVDDALLIQCKHKPIFAYLSGNREMDGVAVRLPDSENIVWVNENKGTPMIPFYKNELLRAFARLRD